MRHLALTCLVVACAIAEEAEAPAAPAAPAHAAEITLLAELPAWDVAVLPGKVAVIDDKFQTVTALDTASGKRAWSVLLERGAPRGRHTLHADGARLLAWFGDHVHVIAAQAGSEVGSYAMAMNGVRWEDGGCGLDVAEGVCAQRCQCSFAVFDCATGGARSKTYQSSYLEMVDPDGKMSGGCWGGGGWLLGKAGAIALVNAEDRTTDQTTRHGPRVTAGIDTRTGTEVWRLPASPLAPSSGHSPDGKTCWFSTASDGVIAVDCASGKQLWSTAAVARGHHLVGYVPGRGVVEVRATSAALRSERTGKPVWSVKLAPGSLAWVEGAGLLPDRDLRNLVRLVILDPATGKTRTTIVLPAGSTLVPDRAGGVLVATASGLVAYDATGAVRARASVPNAALTIGETLITVRTDAEVIVLARATLAELGRIPGKADALHVEGPLGPGRLATFAYDAKVIGKLGLYAVTP